MVKLVIFFNPGLHSHLPYILFDHCVYDDFNVSVMVLLWSKGVVIARTKHYLFQEPKSKGMFVRLGIIFLTMIYHFVFLLSRCLMTYFVLPGLLFTFEI